ncbi:MAG: element excision factor XisH family protein [Aphanizomenon gracile PMC627.10]|uniref:element excision factor XisH family protein n=1 Tax=Dolichospermum sp. LEGE 00240 TaxID=1828603 RepID=UPI001D148F32|nr:element excision factor XisH family protein [Dolichospermum sp. LEGE 00240]MDM3851953.1 element excision factor XisH family protein [Aphanizomenon gracile PMC627.10]
MRKRSTAVSGSLFGTVIGALKRLEPERVLYLAVPLTTYKTFFQLDFPKDMILENSVKMVIYDVEKEVIFQWIN